MYIRRPRIFDKGRNITQEPLDCPCSVKVKIKAGNETLEGEIEVT